MPDTMGRRTREEKAADQLKAEGMKRSSLDYGRTIQGQRARTRDSQKTRGGLYGGKSYRRDPAVKAGLKKK